VLSHGEPHDAAVNFDRHVSKVTTALHGRYCDSTAFALQHRKDHDVKYVHLLPSNSLSDSHCQIHYRHQRPFKIVKMQAYIVRYVEPQIPSAYTFMSKRLNFKRL